MKNKLPHTNNNEVEDWTEEQWNEFGIHFNLTSEVERANLIKRKLTELLHQELQKAREQWLREVLHTVDRINISTEIEFIQPKDQYGYYRCQEYIKKAIQK